MKLHAHRAAADPNVCSLIQTLNCQQAKHTKGPRLSPVQDTVTQGERPTRSSTHAHGQAGWSSAVGLATRAKPRRGQAQDETRDSGKQGDTVERCRGLLQRLPGFAEAR